MKVGCELMVYLIIFIIIATTGFFIERYKYQDCKKVGHTALYCFLNMGK